MTDTEILDWMQQNVTGFHEGTNERTTVMWLDKSGIPQTTEGNSLRDCIRGAIVDSRSRNRRSHEGAAMTTKDTSLPAFPTTLGVRVLHGGPMKEQTNHKGN